MEDAVAMSSATSSPPARGTAYAIDILIRGSCPRVNRTPPRQWVSFEWILYCIVALDMRVLARIESSIQRTEDGRAAHGICSSPSSTRWRAPPNPSAKPDVNRDPGHVKQPRVQIDTVEDRS